MVIETVCVYCASSEAVDPSYRGMAVELGEALAGAGWNLVHGGGGIGLMGDVARAALGAGAKVTGIIPHRLADREVALHELTELIEVDTMRERKRLMDERADAFVILPGGIGTLEELVEMLTLKQLGYHSRAIVVLDAHGYWDPLLDQLQRMVDERMARHDLLTLYEITRDVAGTVKALHDYTPPPRRAVDWPRREELEVIEAPDA
jgi:uncharacterized protein (TIGR00730 family)